METKFAKFGRIGGTTVSAIAGVNPWETPHSAYLKLRNEVSPTPDNTAMERGRRYENVVAQIYQAAHPDTIIATNERNTGEIATVIDPEHDYLIGHPDRYILRRNELGERAGIEAGLEIKTANLFSIGEWGEDGTDNVPTHYLVQCQWYAGLQGIEEWRLAAAFLDTDGIIRAYHEYVIKLHHELYNLLRKKAIDFWNEHVLSGVPPVQTEIDSTTERWINEKFPRNIKPVEYANLQEDASIREYIIARDELKLAESHAEQAEARLKLAIGDRDGLISTQYGKVTWKTCKDTEKTDWRAVAEELAAPEEIVKRHTKTVAGTRRFCTKGLTYGHE